MPRGSTGVKKEAAKKAAPAKRAVKKTVAPKPITAEAPKRGRGRPPGSGTKKSAAKKVAESHILEEHKFEKPAKVSRSTQPGISITVQIPPLRRPRVSDLTALRRAAQHRRLRNTVIVAMVIAGLVGGGLYVQANRSGKLAAAKSSTQEAVRTAPSYTPLVPSSTQAKSTNFDGKKNLVSFDSTFSDARVTVSEQALPSSFLTDPSAMLRAADSINASQRIQTDKGTVYIASSTTDDSQMGLFADTSAKVLLFIHTDKKLDDASWKSFVELMQTKSWSDISKS